MSSNYFFENPKAYGDVEDNRWRVNTTGMSDGVSANLTIDAAAKADAGHRKGNWILSGCPVYFDDADNTVKVYTETSKSEGKAIYGVLFTSYRIADTEGEFYDTIPVAVQRRGEIIHKWLPVEVDPADLPPTLLNTIL